MKQNNTINILFLLLCILLLGFVYMNTRMIDHFKLNEQTEGLNHVTEPAENHDLEYIPWSVGYLSELRNDKMLISSTKASAKLPAIITSIEKSFVITTPILAAKVCMLAVR